MIFFDNASTTQVDESCLEIIKKYCIQSYFNPSAPYHNAVEVGNSLKLARQNMLSVLKGDGQLIFTSSGTESDNLALIGSKKKRNSRIIISASEHLAVMNTAMELQQRGYEVVIAPVNKCGIVDYEKYKQLVTSDTSLISIMHVNNETGGINNIKKLCSYAKSVKKDILFHSDGVQAFGKIQVNLNDLGVDFYSISSHKIHSMKGCGGLFVKKGINIQPLLFGGGQENNIRSSTENIPAIMCFEHMAKKLTEMLEYYFTKVNELKNYLLDNLPKVGTVIAISNEECSPYIISLALNGVRGEVMLHSLEKYDIMIGTGSACSSSKPKPIKSWKTESLPEEYKKGLIRISFNHYNNTNEVDYFIKCLNLEYSNLIKYAKG